MSEVKIKSRKDYEQTLLRIVHVMPLERITQVIDFARFIETQLEEPETAEEIEASEAKWDELLARPDAQAKLLAMANEALAEEQAGLTFEMEFDEQDNLVRPPKE